MNIELRVIAAILLGILASLAVAQTGTSPPTNPPGTNQPPVTPPPAQPAPTPMPSNTPNPQATQPVPRSNDTAAAKQGLETSPPADFSALDRNRTGYLTRQDASRNAWLNRNFASCDTDANGQITRAEYVACTKNR